MAIHSSLNKGFTLIELIIAITIIAVLTVGLIAGLDPIERINQGRDTANRNIVLDLHKAIIAYAGINSEFPTTGGSSTIFTVFGNNTAMLTNLTNSGNLPKSFNASNGTVLSTISVYFDTTNQTVMTCYKPVSKQFSNQPGMYTPTSSLSTLPTLDTGSNACGLRGTSGAARNCLYCAQ